MEKKTMKQKLAMSLVLILLLVCIAPVNVLAGEEVPAAVENEAVGNNIETEETTEAGLPEGDQNTENDVTAESAAADDVQVILEIMYLDEDTDIRVEPNGLSAIIVTAPAKAELNVYEYNGFWAKVSYSDAVLGLVHGYVYCVPDDASLMAVEIFSSRRSIMAPGETVCLTSVLYGLEGYTVSYQWECDKGSGFEPVAGATSDSYSFIASVETLGYDWRLTVYVD